MTVIEPPKPKARKRKPPTMTWSEYSRTLRSPVRQRRTADRLVARLEAVVGAVDLPAPVWPKLLAELAAMSDPNWREVRISGKKSINSLHEAKE